MRSNNSCDTSSDTQQRHVAITAVTNSDTQQTHVAITAAIYRVQLLAVCGHLPLCVSAAAGDGDGHQRRSLCARHQGHHLRPRGSAQHTEEGGTRQVPDFRRHLLLHRHGSRCFRLNAIIILLYTAAAFTQC